MSEVKKPYPQEADKERLDRDIRSLILLASFCDRLRYKKEGDKERSREGHEFTNGDKSYLALALFDYLASFERDLDTAESRLKFTQILFASDIADSMKRESLPEIYMSNKQLAEEMQNVITHLGSLPDMGGFRDTVWSNYLKYKASFLNVENTPSHLLTNEEIKLGRLAKACKGISLLLYLANKDKKVRDEIMQSGKIDRTGFEKKYIDFICENPKLLDIYRRLCGIVFKSIPRYSTREVPEIKIKPTLLSNEPSNVELASHLIQQLVPKSEIKKYLDIFSVRAEENSKTRNEVLAFFRLLNIKMNYRFGEGRKGQVEHRDSVPEHTFFMMILAIYYFPLLPSGTKIDFGDVFKKLMYHDIGEALIGDVPTHRKSTAEEKSEHEAVNTLYKNYFPRANFLHERLLADLLEYEVGKKDYSTPYSAETFIKAIDMLESFINVFDPQTADKQSNIFILDPEKYLRDNKAMFENYPLLRDFVVEIIKLRNLANPI